MAKQFAIYIVANKSRNIIYIGVTSNLQKRVWEHKSKVVDGFTKRYNITDLMYYKLYDNAENAILREKRLKKYKRVQKDKLVIKDNPEWKDLYETLF